MSQETPEEIWEAIFSLLQPDDYIGVGYRSGEKAMEEEMSIMDLSAVTRTSQKFYRIAKPFLYRTLFVQDVYRRQLLIRTFCERPELGQHVRNLRIGNFLNGPMVPSYVTQNALVYARPRLPRNLSKQIYRSLSGPGNYRMGAEMAFMLLFVPRLERLNIILPANLTMILEVFKLARERLGPVGQQVVVSSERAQEVFALQSGHFSGLKTILFERSDQLNVVYGPLLSAALQFPKVTTLSCPGSIWDKDLIRGIPEVLSLRYLNLDSTIVDGHELGALLSRSPDLRTLRIRFLSTGHGIRIGCRNYDEIGEALRKHASPLLEELTIDPGSLPETILRTTLSKTDKIGSLRALKNLKKVDVSLEDLFGMQIYLSIWSNSNVVFSYVNQDVKPTLDDMLPDSIVHIVTYAIRPEEELQRSWEDATVKAFQSNKNRTSCPRLIVHAQY